MSTGYEAGLWDAMSPDERGLILEKSGISRNVMDIDLVQVDDLGRAISLLEQEGAPESTIEHLGENISLYGGIMGEERIATIGGGDRIVQFPNVMS